MGVVCKMKAYLDILEEIIDYGEFKGNRTGIRAKSISGAMFKHDMAKGFPLLTTKSIAFKQVAIELEFFIKGLHSKKWLQDRGCHIWDSWCDPSLVPYGNDEKSKLAMAQEDELGRIYGVQWRDFRYIELIEESDTDTGYDCGSIDQLAKVVNKLKTDSSDRRMIVSAWNPGELNQMALPPCHLLFQVVCTGENFDTLNLNWFQRSVDTCLGLPFNIASYALLLKLLALESGKKEGKLCGMLGDVHIYENQLEGVELQLGRIPLNLPTVQIPDFTNIFDWTYEQRKVVNYRNHGKISFEMAV